MVITLQYLHMDRQVVENLTQLKGNKTKNKEFYSFYFKTFLIKKMKIKKMI